MLGVEITTGQRVQPPFSDRQYEPQRAAIRSMSPARETG